MASLPFTTTTAKQHSLPPLSKLSKPTESPKLAQTHFTRLQDNAKNHHISDDNSFFPQISSLCKQGQIQEAVDLFTEMKLRNLRVLPKIYGKLLQGCVYERDLSTGRQIHARIVKNGELIARNEYVETKLVILYAKCDVYCVANRMFRMVSEKNVFAWAAIIGLNCRMGFCEEALLGFREMLEFGFLPDNFVDPNALKACGALQWIGLGKGVHGYVTKMGFGECVFVATSLVGMYGKCGALEGAQKMFDRMPERDVVTWNSLIIGHVQNGMNEEAIKMFYDMRMERFELTQVTMLGFL